MTDGIHDDEATTEVAGRAEFALLYRYEVTYFDSVDWARKSFEVIANNEEQVFKMVDAKRSRECRSEPYSDGNEDSLEILLLRQESVPFAV